MTEKGIESQGTPLPTPEEAEQFSIKAYKGIDIGLGQADPLIEIAKKLSAEYPGHMILVQQGKFLHGYDKTAYALSTLKNYRLKLVGTTDEPHIRVGFPASNFKRRLWTMVADFGIPYLGYVVWPNHVSAGSYMRARYHRCLRLDAKGENKSSAINSYQAMLRHTGAQL